MKFYKIRLLMLTCPFLNTDVVFFFLVVISNFFRLFIPFSLRFHPPESWRLEL